MLGNKNICSTCGLPQKERDMIRNGIKCKRCNSCELKRRKNKALDDIKKLSPGKYARHLIGELEFEINKKPDTLQQKRRKAEEKFLAKQKKEMYEEMYNESAHFFCQFSGIIAPKEFTAVHHIIYRSEIRNHPEIHNKANLIIVLDRDIEYEGETIKSIHRHLHDKKSRRKKLVEERNLEALFGSRISFYQDIE